jgi:hypothetical protein
MNPAGGGRRERAEGIRHNIPVHIGPGSRNPSRVPSAGTLSAFIGSIFMGQAKQVILVVEDDELLRLHAAGLLEDHGFRVVEAENADTALKLLETRDDVRLLFTDIQMPGSCNGMDLATGSRSLDQHPLGHHLWSNKAASGGNSR